MRYRKRVIGDRFIHENRRKREPWSGAPNTLNVMMQNRMSYSKDPRRVRLLWADWKYSRDLNSKQRRTITSILSGRRSLIGYDHIFPLMILAQYIEIFKTEKEPINAMDNLFRKYDIYSKL